MADLYAMVDWCRSIGASVIQLLPLNDMGFDRVPYASLSAFAMDPAYLSLDRVDAIADDPRLLKQVQATGRELNLASRVNHDAVRREKTRLLAEALRRADGPGLRRAHADFQTQNPWIEPYLAYRVIKEIEGLRSWEEWAGKYGEAEVRALPDAHPELWNRNLHAQWLLDRQLRDAAEYARSNGVLLMGDVPILVSRDSADVWQGPNRFRLDTSAGAPPDMYSDSGQNWGFPTYDWAALWAEDNRWWRDRLQHAQRYFDLYRIDHVVGFFRIWTLKHGSRDGRDGWFEPWDEAVWGDHGRAILDMMLRSSHMLPLAEDLGTIPPVCRDTLKDLGICGLKVQRWEKRWEADGGFIDPADYDPISLATFSTHDTEVLAHWWECNPGERQQLFDVSGHQGEAPSTLEPWLHRELVRWLSGAGSSFYILSLQDVLGPAYLSGQPPSEQRINLPGVVNDTNWTWRCPVTLDRLCEDTDLAGSIRAMISPDRLPADDSAPG